jgi:hypothetical protein
MKKIIYSIVWLALLSAGSIFAQNPGINYQAVVRDGNGAVLANQSVQLRFQVNKGSPNGSLQYREAHTVSTDGYGHATLVIGRGTVEAGSFSGIDWGSGKHFIRVELGNNGGWVTMGTEELQAVPYALHALNGGGSSAWSTSGSNISNSNSGYVGIGTTSPISDLHIDQSGGASSNQQTGGLNLENGSYHWRMYNSNNFVRFNYSSDNGATFTPKAYINPTDGSWNQLSDRSVKRDFEQIGSVLTGVMALQPMEYHYNDNPSNAKKSLGFIAQEVGEVFPEVVSHEEGETLLGMDYSKMAVIAIKAIQEQQAQIEALKEEIKQLKKN